ncbi:LpqN/LpqT family lipoprotein [Mycolicibacterium fortuitum]|uniref:LpqN/LpqT family lipoprotein n=1 Tax=Mycolicibacterium fortuitum TaxID=1766 RepID=UPI000B08D363|nr:LpqN/LpqT family lipoprotein [Mycolicibacterium fortuitum]
MKSPMRRWRHWHRVVTVTCVAVTAVACSSSPTGAGTENTQTISGSLDDWQAAVCAPGMPTGPSPTPRTISGTVCHPRIGTTYINFDQFETEYDMNTMLSYSDTNYSAKTTVGGHPFAIWVPASNDGSELAPLEKFGFVVRGQQAPGETSQRSAASTGAARPSNSTSPPAGAETAQSSLTTIADYIKESGITETSVEKPRALPDAPFLNVPLPRGWKKAEDKPRPALGQMVYAEPALASDPPTITVLYSRLTGAVDADAILRLAPNELKNLPGYEAGLEDPAGTLAGYRAYALSGTYLSDGIRRIIGQKTVVIPGRDGLYVLQINVLAGGISDAEAQAITEAFRTINDKTTITR